MRFVLALFALVSCAACHCLVEREYEGTLTRCVCAGTCDSEGRSFTDEDVQVCVEAGVTLDPDSVARSHRRDRCQDNIALDASCTCEDVGTACTGIDGPDKCS
jgi:hypothetical protein